MTAEADAGTRRRYDTPLRVALVGSSGGHLAHLVALEGFWSKREHFWVTFETPDAVSLLREERAYWCHHPTNRNIRNLVRNTVQAVRVLWRERPDVILSSGAAVAVPYFWIGRLLGAMTVFIEVVDRIDSPTLTGRLVRPVATATLIQWPEQARYYPNGILVGPIL